MSGWKKEKVDINIQVSDDIDIYQDTGDVLLWWNISDLSLKQVELPEWWVDGTQRSRLTKTYFESQKMVGSWHQVIRRDHWGDKMHWGEI
jgi:hypothetical protein